MRDIKFDFDDIMIPPAVISEIESRKDINILNEDGMLPLFTAPMDTVVDNKNYHHYNNAGIYTILPRQSTFPGISENKFHWYSYGIYEFKNNFIDIKQNITDKAYALIDIANGHMSLLVSIIEEAKSIYGDKLVLMVGNIANPKTFEILSNAGAQYIRIGIGTGSGCLTSEQTSINYPMASLIKETYDIACTLKNPAKIVADGGFQKYADIIKGLALGADFIMLGSMMNKCLESCADTFGCNKKHDNFTEPGEQVNQYDENIKLLFNYGNRFFKKFRGMSTKAVQKSLGNKEIKTSEGVTKMNPVEYTVDGWAENFEHYLRSALSYTNNKELKYFIGETEFIFISQNAFKRFNK